MLERYIIKDGKKMRYGYTTGSCAAAASKAAAKMLVTGEKVDTIKIDTPKGWALEIEVIEAYIKGNIATCSVKKDGGDDPDNTHGMIITSTVEMTSDDEIKILGGKGVGTVTKVGLAVSPGNPAINPVPQRMIKKEVREVLKEGQGAKITISAPEGEKVALKTFNPRLGIKGGISILGTSGIVIPMSEEAFKESLAIEIRMAAKNGKENLILVPGNYGRDFSKEYYNFSEKDMVNTSNFVGFMLQECVACGIKKVLMIGHLGKFIKLSGGIFHTHSKVADARIEILAAYLGRLGAPKRMIEEIFDCVTTEATLEIITKYGYEKVFDDLCQKAEQRCNLHVHDALEIGVIMFSMDRSMVRVGSVAKKLLEEFKHA